jgi:7,8-dihydropterin-6-yl-methyl-4-(beta-D-ribofuranosyl)aminobenzene 5'-phosphate synthase
MKIVVLADNRKVEDKFKSEHGLSIYVETDDYKYLLDTGASDKFIDNAKELDIDLTKVDYVFISHGHADHIGGLKAFLNINSKAKIILSKYALGQNFYSKRNGLHKISIDLNINDYTNQFILIDEKAQISEEFRVCSTKNIKFKQPAANNTLFKSNENNLVLDDFNHELVACIGTSNILVFVGCGHKGLLNILNSVSNKLNGRIRYVVGGFHLLDNTESSTYESEAEINQMAEVLNKKYKNAEFITGHCTGEKAYMQLKKTLEFRLVHFFTGYKLIEY